MNSLTIIPKQFFSRLFGVLTLFLLSQSLWAQATDRGSIYYDHLGSSNDVSTYTMRAQVNHQFLLDDEGSNLLTVGLGYSHTDLEDTTQSGPDRSRELRTLVPSFSLMRILDEEYSLIVSLRPGFYGNLESNWGDDFRLEGGVVVTKYMNENLTLGLGLGRGTNFGRDLVIPLFQFVYFVNEKIVARGLLPVRASIWYIPTQKWEFGGVFRIQGSLYNIEQSDLNNVKQIGFGAAHVGLATRYNFYKTNFFSLEAGFTAIRRYQWTDKEETSFKISEDPFLERDLDAVPYLSVGWVQKF